MNDQKLAIFWFRRDFRLSDNTGLYYALTSGLPVLPVFIFDTNILEELSETDPRVEFIYQELVSLHKKITELNSSLFIYHGQPFEVWKELLDKWNIGKVFTNHDYEPYANARDQKIRQMLESHGISYYSFKDQVIFEKDEIVKSDGAPYVVFTPYKNKWLDTLTPKDTESYPTEKLYQNFYQITPQKIAPLEKVGFKSTGFSYPPKSIKESIIENYHNTRDYPGIQEGTTRLGVHLRFGTVSIRELVKTAFELNKVFLNELIWREFYMMILHHFPHVVDNPFRAKYEAIEWINNEDIYNRWCNGITGYPMVDAGMRQLNKEGFMHNRVRMIVASFLTKHLLIDWRWGERYFASKLLDFELSSNNGNWQWAAGCGCDPVPYFRIFNPASQAAKFDPENKYLSKWVPELKTKSYPSPIVDHKAARERALAVYKKAVRTN